MLGINGLIYLPDFITSQEEASLLEKIDNSLWDNSLRRRVQHYGYRYDYKARRVTPEMYLGPLPDWLTKMALGLQHNGLIAEPPDQVIINEYEPGQGIAAHIDCEPCFGHRIFSLSLGSRAMMQFTNRSGDRTELLLEPRSLLMMYGEARYDWKHAIPARKSDHGVPRTRRVSLTFRRVTL